MSDNSKLNQDSEYFFGELKKIELSEDDTAGVFSYIAPPSPGFFPVRTLPVMVAPSPVPTVPVTRTPFRPAPMY